MYNITKALNQLKNDLYTWIYSQLLMVKDCFTYINTFLMIEERTAEDAQALINEVFNTNEGGNE